MKSVAILIFFLILMSCGSGSSTSEESKEETSSGMSVNASNDLTLTENDHFRNLFKESVCDKISNDQVASILNIPADQIKVHSNNYQDVISCGWGYYPEDPKAGRNISVTLNSDEFATEQNFKNDIKTIEEGDWVVNVDLDVPHQVIATYRQDRGWLKVYISKTRMLEFQIGPTMQATEEQAANLKQLAIAFAEVFMSE